MTIHRFAGAFWRARGWWLYPLLVFGALVLALHFLKDTSFGAFVYDFI